MTQILLIEPNESLRTILKFNIMKTIGCDVIEKDLAADAISLLEILPDIDLVVCREQVGLENTGLNLANYFESGEHCIPLVVIGKKVSQYKYLSILATDQSWKQIISSIGKILCVDVLFEENKLGDEYVPVSIGYFLNITSTSMGCDVFIRVKKGDEYQFIKRLHSKDQFTREDIEKYRASGLKEFWISKEHFSQFVNYVTSQLALKLEDKKLSTSDRIKLTEECYELTLDRIQSVGIDNQTIAIVDESIKSMQSSLSENNALANFLKLLRENKLSYAYSHSYLCCLLLHKVVGSFEWQSVLIKEKLTYIAYFHDISLSEDLMKYRNINDLENCDLSSEFKKKVLNHANLSAAIVDKFPNIPIGISSIIKEHHGSKTGVGFSDSLSIGINPVSMMFMVVEHFVDEFLKIEGTSSAKEIELIFEILNEKYTKVTYGQTVVALKKLILNKK